MFPPLASWPGSPSRYLIGVLLLFVLATGGILSCTDLESPFAADEDPLVRAGRQLANRHCWTCHAPVSPSSLDRETWVNSVLPAMAPHLGIQVLWNDEYYKPGAASGTSTQSTIDDSTVTLAEWRAIVAYFRAQAPDTLRLPPPPENLQRTLPLFEVRKPPAAQRRPPATAMVTIDTLGNQIYTSDVTSTQLSRWGPDLRSSPLDAPSLKAVDLQFVRDSTGHRHAVFTSIGTMRAVDARTGSVWDLNLETGTSRTLAEQLPRPVCARPGDYDRDGQREWVVCGFGHDIGGLYLFDQTADGGYERTVLRDVPGAVDAETGDFNDDGWLDVMVLFGHSKEGVWLFLNDQNGGFEQRNLVRFPPHYGSSSLEVKDFNDDGRPDLLYTSGDNADYSNILKKFHGAYIYINQGDFQYEERYFHHFNGATETVAEDFDGDGDLDIGMIGFFADLRNPSAQDFVYLEQTEPMTFVPHAPPIGDLGRWISMDAGDYDGDGDPDLVLGNFARRYSGGDGEPSSMLPFVVLENTRR